MPYKVYSHGYNTAIIRQTKSAAVKAARQKRKGARIISTQKTTPAENKQIQKGRWVRTRVNGAKPKPYQGPRGHGPSKAASRKAVRNRRRRR